MKSKLNHLLIYKTIGEIKNLCLKLITNFQEIQKLISLHYRRIVLWNLIKRTKAITLDRQANKTISIASLVSHENVLLYMSMIKSFFFFSKKTYPVTIVDDGTLSNADKNLLKLYIKGIKLVTSMYSDKVVNRKLKNNTYTLKLRRGCFYLKKKIDLPLLCSSKKILILDCDLLFFRKPYSILKWADDKDNGSVIFMSDCKDSYIISDIEADKIFKRKMVKKLNSGIVGFPLNVVDFNLIEKFSKLLIEDPNIYNNRSQQIQAIFALLFSPINGEKLHRLPLSYAVSEKKQSIPDLTSRHYVRAIRELFHQDAIPLFKKIVREERKSSR